MQNDATGSLPTNAAARVPFLDRLRWGVVLLGVTLHAAVTDSGVGGWYYHEPATLDAPSLVVFLAYELHLQAFFMGLLFLVAGYSKYLFTLQVLAGTSPL